MTIRRHLLATSILGASAMCTTQTAHAQSAGPQAQTPPSQPAPGNPAPADSRSDAPGGVQSLASPGADTAAAGAEQGAASDIVVTAQKRAESLSNVGMAITAATGDQLKIAGIDNVAALTRLDPSFVVTNSNYGAPIYSIRGVNYNNYSLAASPVVSVYSDEVPYPYPAMTKGATYDLERVEVLKGPQGTLYGQSSTAGAINYISAKPTTTFAAGIEGTYGRFDQVNVNGFISGPVTDTLAARLAFNVDEGGAWQKSATRDDVLGNRRLEQGRFQAEFKPNDKLSVLLNVNGWFDRSDSQAGQFVILSPQQARYLPLFPALANAKAPPRDDRYADWYPGYDPHLDEKFIAASARVDFHLSDSVLLTYLGSYQAYSQNDQRDNGGTATESTYVFKGRVNAYTQEARLSGDLPSAGINWLVGVSYQNAATSDRQTYDTTGSTTSYAYVALRYAALPYLSFANIAHDDARNAAAFADATWNISDRFSVHGGARFTDNDIYHEGCTVGDANYTAALNTYERGVQAAFPGSGPFTPIATGQCTTLGNNFVPMLIRQNLQQDNVSWRVGADWKPVKGTLLYASISKGYKAGSFPTLTAGVGAALAPVVQESLLSYETGLKSRLFHDLVEVDGSVFYYDYDNKQLEGRAPTPVGISNVLVNVPRARELGAELALTLRPLRGLSLNVKQTYLDTRILGSAPGYDGFAVATNFGGFPFSQAPRYTVLGDGQYTWRLTDTLDGFFGGNVSFRTSAYSQIGTIGFATPPYVVGSTLVPSYALYGLRAGVMTANQRWRVEAIGDNITNQYYYTQEQKQGDTVVRYMGLPAAWRVRVAYRF